MAFRWTDFMVRVPAIGLIARNAKNFQTGRQGWMNAEEKLCGVYKPIRLENAHTYCMIPNC